MSKTAPKPKGRTASGELEETKVINEVETKVEASATNEVESKTPEATKEFPIIFFGRTVNSQEELEDVKKSFDESIEKKMKESIELTDLETGYKLSLEPKESVFLARNKGEPNGAFETVTMNGYKYIIKKGVRVLVPRSVSKILDNHLISEDKLVDESIDSNEEKKNALQ